MDLKGAWVVASQQNSGQLGIIADSGDENVEITWNSGIKEAYKNSVNDIRVYDLAPTGITQGGITCDGCNMQPIIGTRWKCTNCADYDLCGSCYHGNMHSLDHSFNRITNSNTVKCGPRKNQQRKKVYGFFPGAKVKRGRDWEWGAQDGGPDKVGTVISLYNWKGPFNKVNLRSGVSVQWENVKNNENNYRIGFQGKMDLVLLKPVFGGYYYENHLPTIEAMVGEIPQRQEKKFNVGDLVTIDRSIDMLKRLQEGHGGYLIDMNDCIGAVGRVIETPRSGDPVVAFNVDVKPTQNLLAALFTGKIQQKKRWMINASTLKKVQTFAVNDEVTVIKDGQLLGLMQQNIGAYAAGVEMLNGKNGVVQKPFDGKAVSVKFGPELVLPMSVGAINKKEAKDIPIDLLELFKEALVEALVEQTEGQTAAAQIEEIPDKNIVTCAYEKDYDGVKKILEEKPFMVDAIKNGKTALHVALIQSDDRMAELLLNQGADVTKTSDTGETPLHYAATSDLYGVGRQLIRRGCPMNVKNEAGFTALHIAVTKEYDCFIRMLVSDKCDPNIKNPLGNTAILTACEKGNREIAEMLLSCDNPNCDITIMNKNGFNALHCAVLKGHLSIVQMMCEECPGAIDIEKTDGFAPLHIAVVNGREEMIKFLLNFYQAGGMDLRKRTKDGHNALHLACIEGYLNIVEILLQSGMDINEATPDENTALHLCVQKHLLLCNLPQQLHGFDLYPDIRTVKNHFENKQASGIVIACFLLENGASVGYMNGNGQTCIDVCSDNVLKKLLLEFSQKQATLDQQEVSSATAIPPTTPTKAAAPDTTERKKEEEAEVSIETCPLCHTDVPIEGRFQPCGHAIVCFDHAECMKKCPECKTDVAKITRVSVERLPNCMICREQRVNVTFQPCGHQIACYGCGKRFNVCLNCDQRIQAKVPITDVPPEDLEDGNEASLCNICFERRRNTTFLCGHGACKTCAYVLRECHICRQPIEQIIQMYD